MLEMAINNVEVGNEKLRVESVSVCGYVEDIVIFLVSICNTDGHTLYSKLFTTHLYIIDRHFKHIEPRLRIFIFLYQELNDDSKNISFNIFFC